jgi:hypothetical protein
MAMVVIIIFDAYGHGGGAARPGRPDAHGAIIVASAVASVAASVAQRSGGFDGFFNKK